jgi:hypothetical protein
VAQAAVQNVANSAQAAIGEHPDQTAATSVGPALNAAVVRSAQHATDVITAAAKTTG